jgi:hypothetical protein
MTCLSSIKFSMLATIERNYKDSNVNTENAGSFQSYYDDVTGEVKDVWVATDMIPDDKKTQLTVEIPCLVSPSYTVSQANDINYKGTQVIDTERLVMKIPSRYHVYTTDRVTAIRTRMGELIYEDDQTPKRSNGFRDEATAAIYNIVGVLPVTDPFGKVIERQVRLEKFNG